MTNRVEYWTVQLTWTDTTDGATGIGGSFSGFSAKEAVTKAKKYMQHSMRNHNPVKFKMGTPTVQYF